MFNLPYKIKAIILIVIILVLLGAGNSFAYITGSPHDFSEIPMTGSEGEICKICHIPHNSGSSEVPLWRTSLTSSLTYLLYSSDTLNGAVNQPLGPTKACLTCHDGSVARSPVNGCSACHQNNNLGTDLSNDHPVSFVFNSALAQKDGALHDPDGTQVSSLGGKTIRQGMLYQDRLECSSCHDVHAKKGDSATAPNLLLVDNKDDKLCLTCHTK